MAEAYVQAARGRAYDLVGTPILELPEDSKAVRAVKGIFEKIFGRAN